MSKVKRLRKKYRALCCKVQNTSTNQGKSKNDGENLQNLNSEFDQIDTEKKRRKSQLNNLYDMIIESKGNNRCDLDSISTHSISKSIKSNLSGKSILKKDKRHLKHELFMKKLELSAENMNRLKKSKRKRNRSNRRESIPLYSVNSVLAKKSNQSQSHGLVSSDLKALVKNRYSGKGLTKRRNTQMMKDIEQFQNLLESSSTGSQFENIQSRILDRLNLESVESVNLNREKT